MRQLVQDQLVLAFESRVASSASKLWLLLVEMCAPVSSQVVGRGERHVAYAALVLFAGLFCFCNKRHILGVTLSNFL